MSRFRFAAMTLPMAFGSLPAIAQSPAGATANPMYWQAFPPGGESDRRATGSSDRRRVEETRSQGLR